VVALGKPFKSEYNKRKLFIPKIGERREGGVRIQFLHPIEIHTDASSGVPNVRDNRESCLSARDGAVEVHPLKDGWIGTCFLVPREKAIGPQLRLGYRRDIDSASPIGDLFARLRVR